MHAHWCHYSDELVPYCYSDNASVAAYALGAMANITVATSGVGGALDSSTEVVEVGTMVIESLMVTEVEGGGEEEGGSCYKYCDPPFKVTIHVHSSV